MQGNIATSTRLGVPRGAVFFFKQKTAYEIPKGQRNKYEMDHETGRIRLERMLFTSTQYPADYGYIDNTLGEDGAPLDAPVLPQEPTLPGCLIRRRTVAMFRMKDAAGADTSVL